MGQLLETDLNSCLGDAYRANWDSWLIRVAIKLRRIHDPALPVPNGCTDPLEVFEVLYNHNGAGAVFDISRRESRAIGFDVSNFVLAGATDPWQLARRWQGIIHQHGPDRLAHGKSAGDALGADGRQGFVFAPGILRPANLRPYGPAMMTGVAIGFFEQVSTGPLVVHEIRAGSATRCIYRDNRLQRADMEPDSTFLIHIDDRPATPGRLPTAGARARTLEHLGESGAVRLVDRLAGLIPSRSGRYLPLSEAARTLGYSSRSLSRRLGDAGICYGNLSRHLRLRHACLTIAAGETNLDEVAFSADYADRHHMARDFRQMARLSPSGVRDILHG